MKITPTEVETRATQREKVLTALKGGPISNYELIKICQRFGARIHELREEGHVITTRKINATKTLYTYGGE